MNRWRLLGIVTAVILILDQATKLYVDARFALYESVPVIEGWFHLTYIRNKGAAFGILSNSAVRVPFFVGVTIVALAVILWYVKRLRTDQQLAAFALALIFAGALGNLLDRVRLGEVIDFLDVFWRQHHWPAFNVADFGDLRRRRPVDLGDVAGGATDPQGKRSKRQFIKGAPFPAEVRPPRHRLTRQAPGFSEAATTCSMTTCPEGEVAGQRRTPRDSGMLDPHLRFSVTCPGAPALSVPEFAGYRQALLVGAGMQASAPLGQDDEHRLADMANPGRQSLFTPVPPALTPGRAAPVPPWFRRSGSHAAPRTDRGAPSRPVPRRCHRNRQCAGSGRWWPPA